MKTAKETCIQETGIIIWDLDGKKQPQSFSALKYLLLYAPPGYANPSSAFHILNRFICLMCTNP